MNILSFGHVVLRVRNLARAEAFYHDVLGIEIAGRLGATMTFFRIDPDRHHDFALAEVAAAAEPVAGTLGLDHIAFKIGTTLDDLRAAKRRLEAHGATIDRTIDHTHSKSLYLKDPDGHGVELYVDASEVWRDNADYVPTVARFELT